MPAKMRLEFISEGFREILQSDGTAQVVNQVGQRIADNATGSIPYSGSAGYIYRPAYLTYGGGRVGGYVNPYIDEAGNADYLAMLAEARHKTLTKAVQHG